MVRRVGRRVSLAAQSTSENGANGVIAIESRVARIKQRVAELTGNMQPQESTKA